MATADRKTKPVLTVKDASERFDRTTGRIRQICIEHGIGKVIRDRIRLLTEQDVQKIGRIIEETGHNQS